MRVTEHVFTDSLQQQLQLLQNDRFECYQQLATGQKITQPSDDPAAASRIMHEQGIQDQIEQYQKNGQRAESVATLTSKYLQEQIERINSPAWEAGLRASGTDQSQFEPAAEEVNSLLEQAVSTVNQTFLGEYLFSGVKTTTEPFSVTRDANGKINTITYNGTPSGGAQQLCTVAEGVAIAPYTTGDVNTSVLLPHLQHLMSLRDHLTARDVPAIGTDMESLKTDGDSLINAASTTNATLSRLAAAKSLNSTRHEHLEKQISNDANADFAQAATRMKRNQYAYEAAMQVGTTVLQRSILDYL